jgi:hypothetical protein
MEFEGWDVREIIESIGASVMFHKECDWWTYYGAVNKICPNCKQQIPDEVYAVWALHNWDDLPNVLR